MPFICGAFLCIESHTNYKYLRIHVPACITFCQQLLPVSRQDMDVKGSGLKKLPLPNISDPQRLEERESETRKMTRKESVTF